MRNTDKMEARIMKIELSASCLPGQILRQLMSQMYLNNLKHPHTPATKSKTIRTRILRPLGSQKSFWDEVFRAIAAVESHGPFNICSENDEIGDVICTEAYQILGNTMLPAGIK